ncbi:MAG: protein translocase subunit SecD, partial [Aestuariivita sp.]
MLQIDSWKRILVWLTCVVGLVLALPNGFYSRVEMHNDAVQAIELQGETPALLEQAAAWPSWMPSSLVNLGLDLRGGAHLLAEVKVEDVYEARMEATWPEIRDALRPERAVVGTVRLQPSAPDEIRVRIGNPDGMARALEVTRALARPIQTLSGVGATDLVMRGEGDVLIITLSEEERAASDDRTVQQALEIIRRRIDEVGTREPTIQRQGTDRILIQVPGIGSAAELKEIIGTTAQLTFNPVVGRSADETTVPGVGNKLVPSLDE